MFASGNLDVRMLIQPPFGRIRYWILESDGNFLFETVLIAISVFNAMRSSSIATASTGYFVGAMSWCGLLKAGSGGPPRLR
jgi:hypothetical protein